MNSQIQIQLGFLPPEASALDVLKERRSQESRSGAVRSALMVVAWLA
jgi:hypothetical protein